MTQIKDALVRFNPWWTSPFSLKFKERELHQQLQKYYSLPQIISLTCLRRVGKTTLLLKMAEDFARQGRQWPNILYFSFDEFKDITIHQVIKEYELLMEKDLQKGNYLLLLDELQKIEGWENQLKTVYDLFKGKVKIAISGSESLFVRRKAKETLAGRLFEFKVEPLSFKEFLVFKEKSFSPPSLYTKELQLLFKEYTFTLGFPELINIKNQEIIHKYVQESIIDKILYKDIPRLYKVKDIAVLESLLRIFMEQPGQIIELDSLARELKISRQTVTQYLTYLEEAFLVHKLYNFSKNKRKIERKLKKYYPAFPSIDLLFNQDSLAQSQVFEWLIVRELQAEFFWRDPYKNEVDIVLTKDKIVPVEVKFGQIDPRGVLAFLNKNKIKAGIIVSLAVEEEKKYGEYKIKIIPAYLYLLSRC